MHDLHHNLVQVRSFNFFATTYNHLADQYYKVGPSSYYDEVLSIDITKVCIRREQGYCRIAWTQSSDPDSFKVGGSQVLVPKTVAALPRYSLLKS